MKNSSGIKFVITVLSVLLCFNLYANISESINSNMNPIKIKITVGNQFFVATLENNKSALAFKNMLPISINMIELNGNEKYGELPNELPTLSTNPGKIEIGDLMLYGNQTIVLFYKSFNTSYAYTKIAKIDNPALLYEAIGKGNVNIKIE